MKTPLQCTEAFYYIDTLQKVHFYVRKEVGGYMTITTITNFRKNVYSMVENTVLYNEPVFITSKDGNAVMISEDEYRGLMETLNLISIPGMKEKLTDGLAAPLSETLSEDEVKW